MTNQEKLDFIFKVRGNDSHYKQAAASRIENNYYTLNFEYATALGSELDKLNHLEVDYSTTLYYDYSDSKTPELILRG